MTLRRRLLATLLVAAVPLLAGMLWVREEVLRRAGEEGLREVLTGRMEAGGRERCEADPASVRGVLSRSRGTSSSPAPGPEGGREGGRSRRRILLVYAYDARFASRDPAAPAFPEPLRRELEGGEDSAARRLGDNTVELAVRMPWDEGPCAVLFAQRTELFERREPFPGLLGSGLVLCAGFALAVWVAAGPVVRRIQSLSAAVRRSAATRYAERVPVTGGDEVAELARAFNEAGEEVRQHVDVVERREKTLRDFVANTTHDVMLPLSVLLGHLSRLQKGSADPAVVDQAVEEAQYMASLVHNLAAAAKLETGDALAERHPVDLRDVVERVVARHGALAEARHVEVNHAVPEDALLVTGDVTLLEQAVGNLVGNAIRHNRAGGHVAVVLEESGARRFLLRVADDGPGVPADALPHLGERRFRTDDARQRHPEGRGLGLSIVRDVAARHGFELTFAAGEPSGLVVELRGARA